MDIQPPPPPDDFLLAQACAVSGYAPDTLRAKIGGALAMAGRGEDPYRYMVLPDPWNDPSVAAVRAYVLQVIVYSAQRAHEIAGTGTGDDLSRLGRLRGEYARLGAAAARGDAHAMGQIDAAIQTFARAAAEAARATG